MKLCGALILDFCGPGLCESEFLLLKPPGLRCLVMAPRADGDAVAHSVWGGQDGHLLCEPIPPLLLLPLSWAASGDSDIQPLVGAHNTWTRWADASGDRTGPG